MTSPPRERAINLPAVVLWSIVALAAIQLLRELLSEPDDLQLLLESAFIPARWSLALGYASPDQILAAASGGGDGADVRMPLARYIVAEDAWRPWTALTYSLLHGSWTHVGLNSVWFAAFGTPVAGGGGGGGGILAIVTSFGGAFAQWIADPLSVQPMIGASAIVSGFMGAAATFAFPGPQRFGPAGFGRPESRWAFLGNRAVILFVGVWLAGNLLFGYAAVPLGISDTAIAWQAHVGGLLAGLILFPLIDPAFARTPGA